MAEVKQLYVSYIANCVFNVYLSYTAIMLNSVTIHALRKAASLPKPLKTLLLSLTVSDLGVGLIVQPLFIAVTAMDVKQNAEKGPTYSTYLAMTKLLSYASFLGVMAVSADRFLAIHLHLRYQELVTQKRAVAVVISIWVLSAFASLIRLWFPSKVTYAVLAIIAISCLLTTTLLYYKIYAAVRRHANQISQSQQVHQTANNGERETAVRLRKFAVGTYFVYLTFLVCYVPNICLFVVSIFSGRSITMKVWQLYTATLVFLNSSLNPLIYCWKMRHIRHAVMNTLWNVFRGHN